MTNSRPVAAAICMGAAAAVISGLQSFFVPSSSRYPRRKNDSSSIFLLNINRKIPPNHKDNTEVRILQAIEAIYIHTSPSISAAACTYNISLYNFSQTPLWTAKPSIISYSKTKTSSYRRRRSPYQIGYIYERPGVSTLDLCCTQNGRYSSFSRCLVLYQCATYGR